MAYLVGRQTDDDSAHPGAKLVLEEFVSWFNEKSTGKWGSNRCTDILGEESPEGPDKSHCRELLAESWVRLLGILTMHNIAYASPPQRGK